MEPFFHSSLSSSFFLPSFFHFFFFLFSFLGPHLQHMEVPSLGGESELSCQPTPQPQQCNIQAASVTYTTAQGNAGSLAHRGPRKGRKAPPVPYNNQESEMCYV